MRAVILILLFSLIGPVSAAAQVFDSEQKSEIESIVRDYLLQNPEVIRDAIIELERRQEEQKAQQMVSTIQQNESILLNSRYQVEMGNPNGDVTLVEFFDYNCGFCKQATEDLRRLLDEDPNLRVVLKEFPVLGEPSVEAARVAIAVNEVSPELYPEFHFAMMNRRGRANLQSTLDTAEKVGVDPELLRPYLDSDVVTATIQEVYGVANMLGLTGTPSYVIGDEVAFGAVGYSELKERIKAVRSCGQATC